MRKPKDTIEMIDEEMVICKAIEGNGSEYIVRIDDDGYVEFLKSLDCMWSSIITPKSIVYKYLKNIAKYIFNYNYNLSSINKIIKFVTIPVTSITLSTKHNVIMTKGYIDSLEKSINAKQKIDKGKNEMIKNNNSIATTGKDKKCHTIQECKDYLKSSNLIKKYKIDPNDDSSIEKHVRLMIDDAKGQFGNTLTDDQAMSLVYDRMVQADRNCIMYGNNDPYSAVGSYRSFPQYQPYETEFGYYNPLPTPPLFNNYKNSFPEETSFYGKFNTIKMVLESGKEYYIHTNVNGKVYESKDFDSTALYRTNNLLKYMGGIFEFIKSFDNKSEDKVKIVLNITVNINPSNNILRIYEKEN